FRRQDAVGSPGHRAARHGFAAERNQQELELRLGRTPARPSGGRALRGLIRSFAQARRLKIDEEPHCIQGSGHVAPRFWAKPQQFVQVTSGVMMLVGGSQPALSRCADAGALAISLSAWGTTGLCTGAFTAPI